MIATIINVRILSTSALFIALSLISQSMFAQERMSISVDQAVEIALDNNLSIKVEEVNLENKRITRDNSFNVFYPSISAGTTMSLLNTAQSIPTEGEPNNITIPGGSSLSIPTAGDPRDLIGSLNINIAAQLNFSFQLISAFQFTITDYDRGVITLEQARIAIERDVRKAFYNLLLMQISLENTKESVNLAEERYEQASLNFRNGLVDEFTMLSAQVAWENTKPLVSELEVAIKNARRQFLFLLGLNSEIDIILEGELSGAVPQYTLDTQRIVLEMLDNSPELQGLRLAAKLQQIQTELTFEQFLPTISFGYQLTPSFDIYGDTDKTTGGIEYDDIRGAFAITITQPLDFFLPGSRMFSTLETQSNTVRQLDLQISQLSNTLEIQIRQLTETLARQFAVIDTRALNVDLAQRAFDLAQAGYNAGVRELLEVRDAERELNNARLSLYREQFVAISTIIDVAALLGIEVEELQQYAL